MMGTALFQTIVNGVLPDGESPNDIPFEIEYAPVSQAPTFDIDNLRSRKDVNVEWAARMYAPKFGITPDGAERMVALLHTTRDMLGEHASPTEVYRTMRDTLATRRSSELDDHALMLRAFDDANAAWRSGRIISAA